MAFPKTYVSDASAAWRQFVGVWSARAQDEDSEPFTLVLVPRRPRGGDPGEGTLSGFIAEGDHEGALHFQASTHEAGVWSSQGTHYRADSRLTRVAATLRTTAAGLELEMGGKRYACTGRREADLLPLERVMILGHRGLGFEGLDNRETAFRHAWLFGCDGIEFDVTIPFDYPDPYLRHGHRRPLVDQALIYHPPLAEQTRKLDIIPGGEYLTVPRMFERLGEFHVPYFYVDPKTGWDELTRDPRAWGRIHDILLAQAKGALSARAGVEITLGAPNDATAFRWGKTLLERAVPSSMARRLSWTMEWTELRQPRDILARVPTAPRTQSLSVMRVEGVSANDAIEWALEDLKPADERRLGGLAEQLVFWTANKAEHFEGVLRAALAPHRFARGLDAAGISVMTDYPHRLAHWLAAEAGRVPQVADLLAPAGRAA